MFFDALGAPWPKHPCTVSDPAIAPPSSAFFQAVDLLNLERVVRRFKPSLRILTGPQKQWREWLIDCFVRQIDHNRYAYAVAEWVLHLPPSVIGRPDLSLSHLKLVDAAEIAYAVRAHLEQRKPTRAHKELIYLADALIQKYEKNLAAKARSKATVEIAHGANRVAMNSSN